MSQQINLYNPLFEKKEKPFSAVRMSQALGLVLLALIGLYAYAALQTRSAERLAGELRRQVAAQREQLARLTKAPAPVRSKALEAELTRLEAEVKARQTTLHALNTGELGNTTGFAEFFAALGRQTVPGVWLTHVTIADSGNELLVQGKALRAEHMPAFLRALNNEPIMRGRKVSELKLAAKGTDKGSGKSGTVEPETFLEFSLKAPLQMAEAVAGPAAGTP